jgi:RimJ/RimL family protein N-acetyltransferase
LPVHGIPKRIETERLVIRCWTEDDAPLLREAIDVSLDHLRQWMPWAMDEPSSIEQTRERLRGFKAKFVAGEDFTVGVFNAAESEVIGGSGLHPRIGAGGLEIGYWIRVDRTRMGFATEAARALTEAGLSAPGIERIEIQCDPENGGSRRVPEKLGYRLIATRPGDKESPTGEPRDTLVFEIRRPATGRPLR